MTPRDQNYLVISTMKDEGPYILEWVAWYRTLGFTDFLVYTNDCTDGTDLILQRLAQLGLVRHEYNEVLRRGPHKSALKYARAHEMYAKADWAFVCDVDEFLTIHKGAGKVTDLIGAYPDADVIPVCWRMFSNDDEHEILDGLVTERLIDAMPWPKDGISKETFVKSLFRRTQDVERLGLHGPVFPEDAGETWALMPPGEKGQRLQGNLGQEVAQLNHYAVRTTKSFMIKRGRGRANHTSHTIGFDYWKRWNTGGEIDRSAKRYLPAVRAELKRLLSDDILRAFQEFTMEVHRNRAEDMLKEPEHAALYQALVSGAFAFKEAAPTTQVEEEVQDEDQDVATAQPIQEVPTSQVAPPAALVANGHGELADHSAAQQIIQAILDESERSCRAPNRRKLRQTMLDEVMPKGGRCAEIGVWEGDFSAEILNITKPRELVLIDPWDLLAEKTDEHNHAQHASEQRMRSKYEQVSGTLGRLPNCVVRKGFSAEVLESYPDDYFDWVYIDGNHMYDFVLQDILVSARKVKPGGVIAGDDLYWKKDGRMHVREAMRDAVSQLGDTVKQTRRGAQFIIQRVA